MATLLNCDIVDPNISMKGYRPSGYGRRMSPLSICNFGDDRHSLSIDCSRRCNRDRCGGRISGVDPNTAHRDLLGSAGVIGTSEATVKVHRSQLTRKMGAQSVADLVRIAEKMGVVIPRLSPW
jgi:hypothetical protein